MDKRHTVERMRVTALPFPGFYYSNLDQLIDCEIESHAEYAATSTDGEEAAFPEAIRLDQFELAGLLFHHGEFRRAHLMLAQSYLDAWNEAAAVELGQPAGARFESIQSPREYNFETDRLFAYVPENFLRDLWRKHAADGFETLARVIRKRFTSRDGFISYYSNRVTDWIEKGLDGFDRNELETVIIAALELSYKGAAEDVQQDAEQNATEGEQAYQAFEASIRWGEFERACMKMRADRLAKLDPGVAARVTRNLTGEQASALEAVKTEEAVTDG